jgi:hypothetical protein
LKEKNKKDLNVYDHTSKPAIFSNILQTYFTII